MDGSTGAIRGGNASRRGGSAGGAAQTGSTGRHESKYASSSAHTHEANQHRTGGTGTINAMNTRAAHQSKTGTTGAPSVRGSETRSSTHDTKAMRMGAGNQHERTAKGTYGARVSWHDADPAACCSTIEQIKWAQGVRMGSNGMQEGWKVSEVERLIGLPRRDIQRACYEGAGGAGILSPADSSWGRRLYSKDDLLTLFMVKQERDQGLSLPEVKRLFEEKEGEPGGWRRFVDDQVARMRDEFEDAAWRLASAEALRAATRDGQGEGDGVADEGEDKDGADEGASASCLGESPDDSCSDTALDEVIDRILLLGVLEIMEEGGMDAGNASVAASREDVAAETPATDDARTEVSASASTAAAASEAEDGSASAIAAVDEAGCKDAVNPAAVAEGADGASGPAAATSDDLQQASQALHELWQELADCRAQGCAADAPESQAAVARALDGGAGLTGVSEPAGTASTAVDRPAAAAQPAAAQLCRLLDAPGLELALELRHGPGVYTYIRDAVDAFAAAIEDNATSTNKYQQA